MQRLVRSNVIGAVRGLCRRGCKCGSCAAISRSSNFKHRPGCKCGSCISFVRHTSYFAYLMRPQNPLYDKASIAFSKSFIKSLNATWFANNMCELVKNDDKKWYVQEVAKIMRDSKGKELAIKYHSEFIEALKYLFDDCRDVWRYGLNEGNIVLAQMQQLTPVVKKYLDDVKDEMCKDEFIVAFRDDLLQRISGYEFRDEMLAKVREFDMNYDFSIFDVVGVVELDDVYFKKMCEIWHETFFEEAKKTWSRVLHDLVEKVSKKFEGCKEIDEYNMRLLSGLGLGVRS